MKFSLFFLGPDSAGWGYRTMGDQGGESRDVRKYFKNICESSYNNCDDVSKYFQMSLRIFTKSLKIIASFFYLISQDIVSAFF